MSDCHAGLAPLTRCADCGAVVPVTVRKTAKGKANKPKTPVQTVSTRVWEPVIFFTEGTPVTQGSMRSAGRGRMYHEKGPELRAWRKAIQVAAKNAGAKPLQEHEPVQVVITFYLPRPKSVTRSYPSAKMDVDKLTRAVFDALSEIVIADDGQVVSVQATKLYADGCKPGAHISIALYQPPPENVELIGVAA